MSDNIPNPDPIYVPSHRAANEETVRQEILRKAEQYVSRDRNAVHGNPEDNFATIAKFQQIYREGCARVRGDSRQLPHDVAVDNILQKIARLIQSPYHLDHWIDIAGYSSCGGECRPPVPNELPPHPLESYAASSIAEMLLRDRGRLGASQEKRGIEMVGT